jgi:SAM-dependent methyltransferase
MTVDFYNVDEYGNVNRSWHQEDSKWKVDLFKKIFPEKVVQNLGAKKKTISVLEVGCGAGMVLYYFCEWVKQVTDCSVQPIGLDISPYALSLAEENVPNLRSHCSSIIKSSDLKADILLCIDVLEHLEDPIQNLRVMVNMSPILLLRVPLEMDLVSRLIGQKRTKRRYGHINFFSSSRLLSTLRDSGLKVVDFSYSVGALNLKTDPQASIFIKLVRLIRRTAWKMDPSICLQIFGGTAIEIFAKSLVNKPSSPLNLSNRTISRA